MSFTYNDFVNKAKIIHDNIYDYSKVEYINYYTRVDIICNKHGIFSQKPSEHLQGCGCQECGKEKIWNVMPRFCPTINNFTNELGCLVAVVLSFSNSNFCAIPLVFRGYFLSNYEHNFLFVL